MDGEDDREGMPVTEVDDEDPDGVLVRVREVEVVLVEDGESVRVRDGLILYDKLRGDALMLVEGVPCGL